MTGHTHFPNLPLARLGQATDPLLALSSRWFRSSDRSHSLHGSDWRFMVALIQASAWPHPRIEQQRRRTTHKESKSSLGRNSLSRAVLSKLRFERSMEVSSSQYGSNGCTSVITCTNRSCATPKLHSVRNVALPPARLRLGVDWDAAETRRETWRDALPPGSALGKVLGSRCWRG